MSVPMDERWGIIPPAYAIYVNGTPILWGGASGGFKYGGVWYDTYDPAKRINYYPYEDYVLNLVLDLMHGE